GRRPQLRCGRRGPGAVRRRLARGGAAHVCVDDRAAPAGRVALRPRVAPLRVTFLVPYPPGCSPGQRFRFEQWLRLLPEGAVDADIRPLLRPAAFARLYEPGGTPRKAAQTTAALARRLVQAHVAKRADVVFVYRGAFVLGPPLLEALLERRVPVVYDFDDAIWQGGTSDANALAARLKRPEGVGRIVAGAAAATGANQLP